MVYWVRELCAFFFVVVVDLVIVFVAVFGIAVVVVVVFGL